MKVNLSKELANLQRMGPTELRAKHHEVFGEPIQTGNKPYLQKRIAWRLQMLAEGDVSDRAKRRASELANDADIRMTVPKAPLPPARIDRATVTGRMKSSGPAMLMLGTVLTRHYKGRLYQTTVLESGFDFEGEVFKSLSAVAKKVTGSHWNGHLFFGLRGGNR